LVQARGDAAMLEGEARGVGDPVAVGAQHKVRHTCASKSSGGALALET
jgi:hypothetical protein